MKCNCKIILISKSIGFQTLLRTKYVPSLVKIHWRILILECSQGCYAVKIWPSDLDLWPWKSIGFQILLRTMYVPSLVKIHWRMLILECSQGCYAVNIWPGDLDLWPWKSIGFQILLRIKHVPSLVKIRSAMTKATFVNFFYRSDQVLLTDVIIPRWAIQAPGRLGASSWNYYYSHKTGVAHKFILMASTLGASSSHTISFFLAHLAKGHMSFCNYLASVRPSIVRRKLSHLNLLLWNRWIKLNLT
jgi:hypothetical protein